MLSSRCVPFTEKDMKHLVCYLVTRRPTHSGQIGSNVFKELEQMVCSHAVFVVCCHYSDMGQGSKERRVHGMGESTYVALMERSL